MKSFQAIALALILGCTGSGRASATTYFYTGNNFTVIGDNTPPAGTYTTSMSVTGSFDAVSLPPNQPLGAVIATTFSFSDGRNTITNGNVDMASEFFELGTDALGNINQWHISLATELAGNQPGDQFFQIQTVNFPFVPIAQDSGEVNECTEGQPGLGCDMIVSDVGEANQHGSWSTTAPSTTPLPGALPLFSTGLGALGLLGWRRKRKPFAIAAQ